MVPSYLQRPVCPCGRTFQHQHQHLPTCSHMQMPVEPRLAGSQKRCVVFRGWGYWGAENHHTLDTGFTLYLNYLLYANLQAKI